MPKRTDLKKIMVIGSGPIVIGQACEFDYSGTQGIKALKEEGYEVVLVNSNPATIMTDPGLADRTYIEPIEPETVAAIVRKERPCAILPTLGGQTGLNTALALAKSGVLAECGTELIGARAEVIEKAESRELFRQAMENIGLKVPQSAIAHNMDDVRRIGSSMPFPMIIRPAFTLGGTGGGIAYNMEDLEEIAGDGLTASPVSEVMIEQSVIGWKEFEMEVMRDTADNCVIVCSIENVDAMGVHTGDSITVAPAQTLTDREYQKMRDASLAIMREIGVETGGSNVQFGVNPANGELVIIEMNPRVSRSSALASKATGFPIAKIAAKLAVGYTLDELRNDITRETSASFEPTIDYCVVKIPRFTFEKFPGAKDELTTSMKSVGETMAIGRTFKESLQKGLRSLEIGAIGLGSNFRAALPSREELMGKLRTPNSRRMFAIRQAMLVGFTLEELHEITLIDPWFLRQIKEIVDMEGQIRDFALANSMTPDNPEMVAVLRKAKEFGFSDRQLAEMWKKPEGDIRALRRETGTVPTYYLVDTCAAEFEAYTPYFYSTYETGQEVVPADRKKVIILGGGPNRIGQGIEFDYCCCHASFALKDAGVMEHIEEAGIHSGDSSCVLPPYSLPAETVAEIERQTVALAKELRVVGLMNIQFAVKDGVVFILEVNPRASRTAPFVSKATGVPLPRLATQVMLGKTLKELDPWSMRRSGYVSVKESVFPFRRFPGVDILLGPEMRSTGEVMGIAPTFEEAFLKGQWGAGQKLPEGGKVFLSVNDRDKRFVAEVARQYVDLGFELLATSGTAGLLAGQGIPSTRVLKVYEGRPNIVDLIKNGEVSLVINTASGKRTAHDSKAIRQATLHYGVPYSTTLSGAKAIARAIGAARTTEVRVKSLQEYYKGE